MRQKGTDGWREGKKRVSYPSISRRRGKGYING